MAIKKKYRLSPRARQPKALKPVAEMQGEASEWTQHAALGRLLEGVIDAIDSQQAVLSQRRLVARRVINDLLHEIERTKMIRVIGYVFPFDEPAAVLVPCTLNPTDMRLHLTDAIRSLRPD